MRYDSLVTLITPNAGERYDPVTSKWTEVENATAELNAKVATTSADTASRLYGNIEVESLTIWIRSGEHDKATKVQVKDKTYKIDRVDRYKYDTVIYASRERDGT